jgi:hypothetical protein
MNRDVGKGSGSQGYQRRTAREARSTLATILNDARSWVCCRNACTKPRWTSPGSCTNWKGGSTEAARRTDRSALRTCPRFWLNCWPGTLMPPRSGNAPAATPRNPGAPGVSTCFLGRTGSSLPQRGRSVVTPGFSTRWLSSCRRSMNRSGTRPGFRNAGPPTRARRPRRRGTHPRLPR